MEEDQYRQLREMMVRQQIEARGIRNRRLIEAMLRVPRHLFVPEGMRDRAYDDTPLPIGEGQTISQPYMVAWMTELLEPEEEDRVLEVGTGSGYQTAILCELAAEVFSIEKNAALAGAAKRRLTELGYRNLRIRVGDGTLGWPEEAPFDGILVTAGAPSAPQPLLEQLGEGGRLVIPIGSSSLQMLTLIRREENEYRVSEEGTCVFVPLVGRFGWQRGSGR